jgi:hypothetical protein
VGPAGCSGLCRRARSAPPPSPHVATRRLRPAPVSPAEPLARCRRSMAWSAGTMLGPVATPLPRSPFP